MRKRVKIPLIIFATLAGLLLLGMLLLPLFLHPENYKDDIAALAMEQGYALTFQDEFAFSSFPAPTLDTGRVSVALRPAEGERAAAPFAVVENVSARVRLLPILRGEVRLDYIRVEAPELALARDGAGKPNWAPGPFEPDEETVIPQQISLPDLGVEQVELSKARVGFRDERSGVEISFPNLTARVATFPPTGHSPATFFLNTRFSGVNLHADGNILLSFALELAPEHSRATRVKVQDLVLDADLKGEHLPGGALNAKVRGDELEVDLVQRTGVVGALTVDAYGARAQAQGLVKTMFTAPDFDLKLNIPETSLRDVLAQMGASSAAPKDPNVLRTLAGAARLKGGLDALHVQDLAIQVDKQEFTGEVSVLFSKPELRFTLTAGALDLTPWLAGRESANTRATAVSTAPAPPPEARRELSRWSTNGRIKAQSIRIAEVLLQDFSADLTGGGGEYALRPKAGVMNGDLHGELKAWFNTTPPKYTADLTVIGVDLEQALAASMGYAPATGISELHVSLRTHGDTPPMLLSNVAGDIEFTAKEGILPGILLSKDQGESGGQDANKDGQPYARFKGNLVITPGGLSKAK